MKTVSVVMAVYNDEKHSREAIENITNQSCTDVGFVILNDGSTDTTVVNLFVRIVRQLRRLDKVEHARHPEGFPSRRLSTCLSEPVPIARQPGLLTEGAGCTVAASSRPFFSFSRVTHFLLSPPTTNDY